MNKIKCPHCNNVNILNSNIKICVFKCPCCGKEVTVNNCCNGVCTAIQNLNEVYCVIGTFCFAGGIKETKLIKIFSDFDKADDYIKDANANELLESYKWFEKAEQDYIETIYSVEKMKLER